MGVYANLKTVHKQQKISITHFTKEEKTANLLYFIIKDHPFVDGCKRIAATTFLYFLDMNRILYNNNKKILSDSTLVALTLLIAESKPQEKEIMINTILQ
ncbi:Fic family protein [Filifactor villosus]|uniref:Fic family protein n=1 Tax=Filifactor villosus TaxID=29374 RepID=A0ABV9QLW3_9FIRM